MSKYIFKIFLLFMSLIWWSAVQAQKINIVEKVSKKPIEFVIITQPDSQEHVLSNENGIADITSLNPNEPYIFYFIGYKRDTLNLDDLKENNYIIELTKESFIIDEIVVSTIRWAQSNGNTPQKISQINTKDVFTQNPQTAADMLGKTGEIFIQKSQQGGGSPMIRGFSANRLVYAVDGVRMNTAIFRSGNLQNVISIDPYSISNTQILYGPGSVAYGSDAIGGVMTFNTKTPALQNNSYFNINVDGRVASANKEVTSHVDLSYGKNKLSGLTSLTYNRFGDLQMGSKRGYESYLNKQYVQQINGMDSVLVNSNPLIQRGTKFDIYHFMQKVRYSPNEDWDLQLGIHYSTTSNYGRYDRLIRKRNELPRSAEWYYGPQKWFMTNLQLKHQKKSQFYDDFITRIAFQNFNESRNERDFLSNQLMKRKEHVKAYSVSVDFLKRYTQKLLLSYGAEAVYNDVESSGRVFNIDTEESGLINSRYPNSNWYSVAAFINTSYKVHNKVVLNAGSRLNYYTLNSTFNTDLFELPFTSAKNEDLGITYSLGAAFRPGDKWYFAINGSSGFRAPNVDDIGKIFDSTPGNIVVPNPGLSTEKAYSIELSASKIFFNRLRLDLTGYYTTLIDGMVRRNFTFDGKDSLIYNGELSRVQATINAAEINIKGIQAGLELKLPKEFKINSRVNWQEGQEELDNGDISNSRHVAPAFGIVRLSKDYKRFYFEFNWQFSGGYSFDELPITEIEKDYLYAKDQNENPFSPSWSTLNFISSVALKNNFSINLSVENILDKQYRPYSSGLAAAGRNYIFSMRYNWTKK